MSHRSGVLSWGSAPNPEVYRFKARTGWGGESLPRGQTPAPVPAPGRALGLLLSKSPILSAGREDCRPITTSVNHDRLLLPQDDPLATCPDRLFIDASNSRSIATYSSTRRTLQLSVYAV